MSPSRAIIGCDLSGTVVSLGSSPTNKSMQVGDKVAGCVHGGLFEDKGSYAEYARAESDLVFKVPEGEKMEEMAVFGVPWVTACQVGDPFGLSNKLADVRC
jgi:NADPH:quinone reductase-like Zn-dependent oxidoreductase